MVNAPGFFLTPVFIGLSQPVATRFAPDGRVFIAEKSGRVLGYDSLSDPTPVTVIDVSGAVHNFLDRGLLGLAVHPSFPAENYLYLLYSWDDHGWNDNCLDPPGQNDDGCVINGRLSRFQVNSSNQQVGSESILIAGRWCQQYSSHSIGHLEFGLDGKLYVSAGDGASYIFADYGQGGGDAGSPTPANPCGDPPVPIGTLPTLPTAEGGALRSQDLRTSADATSYDGTILRLEASGVAAAGNPLTGGAVADDDAVIAYGLRNPYRFTVRPGTSELWIAEVGWTETEEINRLADPFGNVENFGWPCFEGNARQGAYDNLPVNLCEGLYDAGGDLKPYYSYPHGTTPSGCPGGGAAVSAISFFESSGDYPSQYDGALFFGDYAFGCIRVMLPGTPGGLPNPANVQTIVTNAVPVDLVRGPGGDLFYTDIAMGTVYRLEYDNAGPTAVALADPDTGTAPLTVQFDGSQSTDPEGDPLTFAWDLDNDGQYDDSTQVAPQWTYPSAGTKTASLAVSDGFTSDTDTVTVTVTTSGAASLSAPTTRVSPAGEVLKVSWLVCG